MTTRQPGSTRFQILLDIDFPDELVETQNDLMNAQLELARIVLVGHPRAVGWFEYRIDNDQIGDLRSQLELTPDGDILDEGLASRLPV